MVDRRHMRFEDLLSELGVDEIGRRYIDDLSRRLEAIGGALDQGARPAPQVLSPVEEIILFSIWSGEDENGDLLPDDLRWDLVMAALHACPNDDGMLWCLGDGPFDHFAARPGIKARLYDSREKDPKVEELFRAMRRTLPSEGVIDGRWFA